MAEDLRERIKRGDLAALADPALPLHLLTDGPTAAWWSKGCDACMDQIRSRLVHAPLHVWSVAFHGSDLTEISFLRHLCALLSDTPPEVDAAPAILARYAGE